MRKRILLVVVALVGANLLGSPITQGVAETSTDDGNINAPAYVVGDFWVYNTSTDMLGFYGEMEMKVKEIDTFQDYWGDSHECYRIESEMDVSITIEPLTMEVTVSEETYERTTDLMVIETTIETSSSLLGQKAVITIQIYSQFTNTPNLFPLILGSEIAGSYNATTTWTSELNGEETTDLFEEPTTGQYTISVDDTLHSITTPAGTFDCVKITHSEGVEGFETTFVHYYSEVVGRDVKNEQLLGETSISTSELLEYGNSSIPGFSFVTGFSLLGIVAMLPCSLPVNSFTSLERCAVIIVSQGNAVINLIESFIIAPTTPHSG